MNTEIAQRLGLIALALVPWLLPAQVLGLEEGAPDARLIERLITLTGGDGATGGGLHPYGRAAVTHLAMDLDEVWEGLGRQDRRDLYRIYKNNNEWLVQPGEWEGFTKIRQPITFRDYRGESVTLTSHVDASSLHARYILRDRPLWRIFYHTPSNAWETHSNAFYIKANPLLRFTLGRDLDRSQGTYFLNQRGVRLRGAVDERIYFHAEILESQARFPEHVRDFTNRNRALPGNGLYKSFRSRLVDFENGIDFLNAQGYVGFRIIPHVEAQFGHGRHVIGHGYRSLILSDFSNNYLYLKFLTRVGRFTYQNIFAELAAFSANAVRGDNLVPKKYMATHYLSFQVSNSLSLGVFESVIYHRSRHFELQYLNPVILYRSAEHLVGSPDNVLAGLTADWRFLRRFHLYGQFLLDEFKFNELVTENRGWWANKYGYQLGLKAYNVGGVDHLDLQVEYNRTRPYTYQHFDSLSNYTHYNMPLAHPLGANFRELVLLGRYQPHPRWVLEARYIHAVQGLDTTRFQPGGSPNYGSDLLRSYNDRPFDYGVKTGQGVANRIHLAGVDLQYELFHQLWLQASWFRRAETSDFRSGLTQYIGGGIRWNMADLRTDF